MKERKRKRMKATSSRKQTRTISISEESNPSFELPSYGFLAETEGNHTGKCTLSRVMLDRVS